MSYATCDRCGRATLYETQHPFDGRTVFCNNRECDNNQGGKPLPADMLESGHYKRVRTPRGRAMRRAFKGIRRG